MTTTRKRKAKPDTTTAGQLEQLGFVVSLAAGAETAALAGYERAKRTHAAAREEYAKANVRAAVAGGNFHAGWLQCYCLCEPLWGEVGHAAYFAVAPGCKTCENPAAWRAVFAAVAKYKGW
jgi:hypothetical protein